MHESAEIAALYTVAQSRAIDRRAGEQPGCGGIELMRRAAAAAFAALRRHWPAARRIAIVAGTGNNGGDAFLLGALALEARVEVRLIALGASTGEVAAAARKAFVDAGGSVEPAPSSIDLRAADVIVDGLLGSGIAREVTGAAADLVTAINACGKPVLALDLPSGLDADSGVCRGVAVHATVTIAFIVCKRGMFTADGADCCGLRELATLDVAADALGIDADAMLLGPSIDGVLAPRRGNSNKGTFGHVCAVGGDRGMGGAIRLCAEAALRAGAGLVTAATCVEHVGALNAARPEILAHGVADAAELAPLLERASVIAIGPGLGRDDWGRMLFEAALAGGQPIVIDADALTMLGGSRLALPAVAVITPHPGEAARLLDCDIAAVQADRFAAVRELAKRHAAVAVLKGAGSLIADRDGRVAVCAWGNPGMASAGMGDVLTGVIAALLAQGLSDWDAACLGVAVHARAGDRAAGRSPRGLLAADLFAPLREMLNPERR